MSSHNMSKALPVGASRRAAQMLTTEDLAIELCVKPQTIRASLCRSGHYMGMRPLKLPNRRLLWESEKLQSILAVGEVK